MQQPAKFPAGANTPLSSRSTGMLTYARLLKESAMKLLPKKSALVSAIIIVLFTLSGCAVKPMMSPSFQSPTSDQKRIHEAVRRALVKRSWVILKNTPNSFEARYNKGGATYGTVRIVHSGRDVSISYVDSLGLKYQDSPTGPKIHRAYNNWVTNLERDIQVNLGSGL